MWRFLPGQADRMRVYLRKGYVLQVYPSLKGFELSRWTLTGYPYRSVLGDGFDPDEQVWLEYFYSLERCLMEKPKQRLTNALGGYFASVEGFIKNFPLLAEHLTHTTYSDGTSRQTSTLLIFTADGVWKAMLKDRAEKLCCFVTAEDFDAVLLALEDAVGDPATVWRVDNWDSGGPSTRRKK